MSLPLLTFFPPLLPLPLQSNYYGGQSQIRGAPPSVSHHHQSSSLSTIHHTQATSEALSLTRQDSPDSGFGNGDPQNSPLNSQSSPLVVQQHSPLAVTQQNSPLMAQQHSPLMQQTSSPLGCDSQQQLPLGKWYNLWDSWLFSVKQFLVIVVWFTVFFSLYLLKQILPAQAL